jgi:hypothetical protein
MSTQLLVESGAVATLGAAIISVIWNKRTAAGRSEFEGACQAPRFGVPCLLLLRLSQLTKPSADHGSGGVVALLEGQFGFNVFWAGRNIRRKADFEAADLSAKSDVAAILDSKYFLLLYPEKLASSVLFEAGIALRSCLTSIYFVRNRSELPFLMSQASQAFTNVRPTESAARRPVRAAAKARPVVLRSAP